MQAGALLLHVSALVGLTGAPLSHRGAPIGLTGTLQAQIICIAAYESEKHETIASIIFFCRPLEAEEKTLGAFLRSCNHKLTVM